MKKTKIVCTIGPKTESEDILKKLLDLGMNVMRLNFSHGNHLEHGKRILNLRNVLKNTHHQAAILLDTKGPEIRTTKLYNGNEVFLEKNQNFIFTSNKNFLGTSKKVGVTYVNFHKDLKIGNLILLDDGLIAMKILQIENENVICKVLNSGFLGENKGVNIPGVSINLPVLSEKDKKDLIFGCNKKVDFIAPSFIRKSSDVLEIRKFLKKNKGEKIQIISKIENQEGLKNFDEILKVSDGIMIARGDLGVEIPIENVIFFQKMIIKKCNEANKVVITATQMLDSMIEKPRPTRAEAGDITNAIIDGTDAVMLSGETAKGKYPLESLRVMSLICKKTDEVMSKIYKKDFNTVSHLLFNKLKIINKKFPLIIIETYKSTFPINIKKYFPNSIILAITYSKSIANQLILNKGIFPYFINKKRINSSKDFYKIGKKIAISEKYVKKGEKIIIFSKKSIINVKVDSEE